MGAEKYFKFIFPKRLTFQKSAVYLCHQGRLSRSDAGSRKPDSVGSKTPFQQGVAGFYMKNLMCITIPLPEFKYSPMHQRGSEELEGIASRAKRDVISALNSWASTMNGRGIISLIDDFFSLCRQGLLTGEINLLEEIELCGGCDGFQGEGFSSVVRVNFLADTKLTETAEAAMRQGKLTLTEAAMINRLGGQYIHMDGRRRKSLLCSPLTTTRHPYNNHWVE